MLRSPWRAITSSPTAQSSSVATGDRAGEVDDAVGGQELLGELVEERGVAGCGHGPSDAPARRAGPYQRSSTTA